MLHFSLSRRAESPEYSDRKRWWGPDEVHHALHPAKPYNEFPSPFSHCMHGDIQLAIKHGLVIQWLMSLLPAMKGLGESQTLGPAAPPLLFLSCFHPFLSCPFATSKLSLSLSLWKMERTICNSVTFMTVHSLIGGPCFLYADSLWVDVTYLIYNTPVLFHLLLLKAFNFYGGTAQSKLCLV